MSAIHTKICFISHSSGMGGAERSLLETVEALKHQGVECRVILPGRGDFCVYLDSIGVPFSVVSFPLWMSRQRPGVLQFIKAVFGTLFNAVVIAVILRRWKCEFVYSSTVTVCVGSLSAFLLRLPHVWHIQEFGFEDQGLSFMFGDELSLAMINRLSLRCIFVSEAVATKYRGKIDQSKVIVAYPSMQRFIGGDSVSDDTGRPTLRKERFRCVIAGALIEGKGQSDAVLAIGHLRDRGIQAELLIVGDGIQEYRRRLEGLVSAKGLDANVTFVGRVKSAFAIMCSANAILVCSKSEAFGRVTVEGMLARKPVIGARAGGTAELISDGVTGLLYRPGDAVDLADRIQYVHDHPVLANALGEQGYQWARERFSVERYGAELLAALFLTGNSDAVALQG